MITNYKLFSALSFVAGAAIGAAVTWKYVNSKYDLCIRDEYDEMEEDEEDEYDETEESSEDIQNVIPMSNFNNKPNILEYASKINELGYANSENEEYENENEDEELEELVENIEEEVDEAMKEEPYVISSEEYDDGEYETETLTLYTDGVLTDWYDEIIEDVEETVGLDAVNNFDKYAEDGDTVFVRNDYRFTDYEIQRDLRKYADVHPQTTEE